MTRDQIIQVFIVRAAPEDREVIQRLLDKMSKEELEFAYEKLQADEKLASTEDTLIQIQASRAADLILHQYRQAKMTEPQRRAEFEAQLKKDRKTFEEAAPRLRSYGVTDANFEVTREILRSGFTEYQIQQMLERPHTTHGGLLSPPAEEELIEWQRDSVEKENLRRTSMDILSLRELQKQEREAQQNIIPELTETQKMRIVEKQEIHQYEKLPDEFFIDGEWKPLDTQLIERLLLLPIGKSFMKRYGSYQIDEARIKRRPGLYW